MPKVRTRISVGDVSIEDFNTYLTDMPWDLGEDLERVTELGFLQWLRLIDSEAMGSIRARRALTWLVLKTAQPHLRYAQVIGSMSELTIENLTECPDCGKDTDTGRRDFIDGRPSEQFCITCGYVYPPEVTVEPARPPKAVKSRASKTAADSTAAS
jgi:rubredoxin